MCLVVCAVTGFNAHLQRTPATWPVQTESAGWDQGMLRGLKDWIRLALGTRLVLGTWPVHYGPAGSYLPTG